MLIPTPGISLYVNPHPRDITLLIPAPETSHCVNPYPRDVILCSSPPQGYHLMLIPAPKRHFMVIPAPKHHVCDKAGWVYHLLFNPHSYEITLMLITTLRKHGKKLRSSHIRVTSLEFIRNQGRVPNKIARNRISVPFCSRKISPVISKISICPIFLGKSLHLCYFLLKPALKLPGFGKQIWKSLRPFSQSKRGNCLILIILKKSLPTFLVRKTFSPFLFSSFKCSENHFIYL